MEWLNLKILETLTLNFADRALVCDSKTIPDSCTLIHRRSSKVHGKDSKLPLGWLTESDQLEKLDFSETQSVC